MLPATSVETIKERKKEILSSNGLRVKRCSSFDNFEVNPYNGDPTNIRFYNDGVEVLVKEESILGGREEFSESRRQHIYLVDLEQKTILEYSLEI